MVGSNPRAGSNLEESQLTRYHIKSLRSYKNPPEPNWTFQNLLKPARPNWNIPEPIETFQNLLELSWAYWNLPEPIGAFQNLLELSRTYGNFPEPIGTHQHLFNHPEAIFSKSNHSDIGFLQYIDIRSSLISNSRVQSDIFYRIGNYILITGYGIVDILWLYF